MLTILGACRAHQLLVFDQGNIRLDAGGIAVIMKLMVPVGASTVTLAVAEAAC